MFNIQVQIEQATYITGRTCFTENRQIMKFTDIDISVSP